MSQSNPDTSSAQERDFQRDGTSQADRLQSALDTDYVSVDERSTQDLLAFVREYATHLNFFEADGKTVKVVDDWQDFLSSDVSLDAVVRFMENPSAVSPDDAKLFSRPHFALLLTFLQLLRHTQDHLNTLTRRHLDFYFRKVLHQTERKGTPDRVNALVDLAPDVEQALLPEGTLLLAGTDSEGQDRFYQTDYDTLLNHAQVAKISSLYVDRQVTGLQQAREQYSPDPRPAEASDAIMEMLQIALGDPNPGDPLPNYNGKPLDHAALEKLAALVTFASTGLNMSFADLRALMKLKRQRDASSTQWREINNILEKAGEEGLERSRPSLPSGGPSNKPTSTSSTPFGSASNKPTSASSLPFGGASNKPTSASSSPFGGASGNPASASSSPFGGASGNPASPSFEFGSSDDFDGNVKRAIGELDFKGIEPPVHSLYEFSTLPRSRMTTDFIKNQLYFQYVDDFYRMMRLKTLIDSEWREIHRLLSEASSKTITFEARNQTFEKLMGQAFPNLSYPADHDGTRITTLDTYYARLLDVERYFYMSAEDFTTFGSIITLDAPTAEQWQTVYEILAEAHRQKVYAERRQALRRIREKNEFDATGLKKNRFEEMLIAALATQPPSILSPLARVIDLIDPKLTSDIDLLKTVSARSTAAQTTAEDWERVYTIIERTQRAFLETPRAEKKEWNNLYSAEDATQMLVMSGSETETPRWQTFGQAQRTAIGAPPPASFGWAISSPLLALNEGERTITLQLNFQAHTYDVETIASMFTRDADSPFVIEISTDTGWIAPDGVRITHPDPAAMLADASKPRWLKFEFTIGRNVAPIAVYPDSPLKSAWPILRVLLRQHWREERTIGRWITLYQPFQPLVLSSATLNVKVEGLRPTQIQNDEAILSPNKPFEPFGMRPIQGARFYLRHPEIVSKRLDSLTFHIEWMGLPASLPDHYNNYPEPNILRNQDFTTRVSLVADRLDVTLKDKAELFQHIASVVSSPSVTTSAATSTATASTPPTGTIVTPPTGANTSTIGTTSPTAGTSPSSTSPTVSPERKIEIDGLPTIIQNIVAYPYEDIEPSVINDDLGSWNRYLQWELNAPDFQHDIYPQAAVEKALALSVAIATRVAGQPIAAESYQVNPPYTPKIKSLLIDYSAQHTFSFPSTDAVERVYHIYPYGSRDIGVGGETAYFLPQFENQGELYIGLQNVRAPQNLSLLFQMAEDSANPDLLTVPVRWSTLSGNRWISLDAGDMARDETRGFINSGIIVLNLKPAAPNTLLDPNLYWIRAAIPHNSESVCDTVAIHTQAVSATLVELPDSVGHLHAALPPETIKELAAPRADIAAIRQLYSSFGGRPAEQALHMYTRVSERLRHKQRAVTLWDYEHMILEQFPEVYKVKCLPADRANPGHVEIVVIPSIVNKSLSNPFEPKASSRLLADIEAFITDSMPPYATVTVKNPHYAPIKLRFAVRFMPDCNEGYYKALLNTELNRFLSPWAYEESANIVIGGRIYANVLINFIEQRPYVDYASNIKLFINEDGRNFDLVPPSPDGYYAVPSRVDGVLVAVPQHEIDMISDIEYDAQEFIGINYMKIELDFIVKADAPPTNT